MPKWKHTQPGNAKRIFTKSARTSENKVIVSQDKFGDIKIIEAGDRVFGFLESVRVDSDKNDDWYSKVEVETLPHDELDPFYFDGKKIIKRSELPSIELFFNPFDRASIEDFITKIIVIEGIYLPNKEKLD